jgi:hypothetical protein
LVVRRAGVLACKSLLMVCTLERFEGYCVWMCDLITETNKHVLGSTKLF